MLGKSDEELEMVKLHPLSPIDCPKHCELERGLLDHSQLTNHLVNSTGHGIQLSVDSQNFTEFCMARACSQIGDKWQYHYQACGRERFFNLFLTLPPLSFCS